MNVDKQKENREKVVLVYKEVRKKFKKTCFLFGNKTVKKVNK